MPENQPTSNQSESTAQSSTTSPVAPVQSGGAAPAAPVKSEPTVPGMPPVQESSKKDDDDPWKVVDSTDPHPFKPSKLTAIKEPGIIIKWVIMFFAFSVTMVSIYMGFVLSEKTFSMLTFLFVPIFLTTFNALFSTAALFEKVNITIAFFLSVITVLVNIASFIFIATIPGTFNGDPLIIFLYFTLEPPFFIPLFLLNILVTVVVFFEKRKPPKEITL